jgi:putative glutamine amidotransferase
MRIAISKASGSDKYALYGAWLKAADPDVEVVDLNGMSPDEAVDALSSVSGVVLSGGPDVEPEHYQQPEKRGLCFDFDPERDALELAVARAAVERNLPMLGICRGFQVLNVAFGGTLVADIPTERPSNVEHRQIDKQDAQHDLHVEPGSLIKRITRTLDGTVNSAHHQGIEKLANLFTPAALASDGLIEAFEWGDASLGGKPFLLAMQWHPERLPYTSPFSLPIAQHFTAEAHAYHLLLR